MKKLLALPLLVVSVMASAHVTFVEPAAVAPNTPFKATLKVPHGCDGSATTAIVVHIPKDVIAVKPQPKAGWKLSTTRAPYGKTYDYSGSSVTEGVNTVTWQGGALPDDQYEEFNFVAHLAQGVPAGTKLHFPVDQTCTKGQMHWTSTHEGHNHSGETGSAPAITVNAPTATHTHTHQH